MNETQTALVARIIRNRLRWQPVDSEGKPVVKTEGDDLELLLKCHKSGIRVEEVRESPPLHDNHTP